MTVEFVMTYNPSLRIALMQDSEHVMQHDHLLCRTIIFVLLFRRGGMSTLVADANRESVVALDMASDHFYGSAVIKRTVSTHIEMISRISAKASSTMAGDELREGEVLIGPRVSAVQDQEINFPGRTMTVRTQQGQHLRPWQWS